MRMEVRPTTLNSARGFLAEHHRHLRRELVGWLFGLEVWVDDERIAIACAGRPKARHLQDGVTLEVTRVCVKGEAGAHPNACSMAYGALGRAAKALGYHRVITYTRADEDAVSVRAAGFVRYDGESERGGEWARPSRSRAPSEDVSPKHRWVRLLRAAHGQGS